MKPYGLGSKIVYKIHGTGPRKLRCDICIPSFSDRTVNTRARLQAKRQIAEQLEE